MKVTHASIRPTPAAAETGRPALTPELLASVAARYSRSDDGLESILGKVDQNNPDKSIDAIFAHVDYGHASIADMVPVAMFMDQVSVFLAYYLWTETAIGAGQESSTRYIKMSVDGVMPFEMTGLPSNQESEWTQFIGDAFRSYDTAYNYWLALSEECPKLTRIPESLLNDTSDKAQKQVARMQRNFAFDRARYFLPVAALTNVMIVQSAREWARIANILNSHPCPEFNMLGNLIVNEMQLVCPRMCRYTGATDATRRMLSNELEVTRAFRCGLSHNHSLPEFGNMSAERGSSYSMQPEANVEIFSIDSPLNSLALSASSRANRYSAFGSSVRRTSVRFSWDAVAMAEIRDLNRHRTGYKWCPLNPQGFYCAMEELPLGDSKDFFNSLEEFGWKFSVKAANELWNRSVGYEYWTLLGTQYYFEHTTQLDKFIYEGELRTGIGSHYRYAQHLHDALNELYRLEPELRHLVMEGTAEPE
jgi:thymidylate synthase ThyX